MGGCLRGCLALVALGASTTDVRVATWQNDARAAISLTFDDGKVASLGAGGDLLDAHGLPGTFYVSSGYLDGSSPHVVAGGADPAVARALARRRLAGGHEVGCHAATHATPLADETLANATMELAACDAAFAFLFGDHPRAAATMAYPWGAGDGDPGVRGAALRYHVAARGVRYHLAPAAGVDRAAVPCVVEGRDTGLEEMASRVDRAVEERAWLCTFNHGAATGVRRRKTSLESAPPRVGVDRRGGGPFAADRAYSAPDRGNLTRHYAALARRRDAGEVYVAPLCDVLVYAAVRATAFVERVEETADALEASLVAPLVCATDAERRRWRDVSVDLTVVAALDWADADVFVDGRKIAATRTAAGWAASAPVAPCAGARRAFAWRRRPPPPAASAEALASDVLRLLGFQRPDELRRLRDELAAAGAPLPLHEVRATPLWRAGGPLLPELLREALFLANVDRSSADLGRRIVTTRGAPIERASLDAWVAATAPNVDAPRDCVEWGSGHARYLDHFPCRSTHVFEYAKEPACGGNIGLFGTMRCGDLEDPATVPEAAYDLVLCFHVFNMLPGASPRVPAAALARLLRRGGSLLWAAPSAVPSFTALPDTLRFTLRGATALFADALCVVDAAPSSDAATTLAALAGFSAEDVPRRGPPDAGLSSMVYLWAVKPADPGFRGCDGYAAGDAAAPAPAGAPAPPVTASCADRPRALRALSSALGAGLDPDAAAAARRRLVDDRTCRNAAP